MYATDTYKICTKCIQNISRILTNFCLHFVYKIKRTMAAKSCMQKACKSLSKCGYILHILCIHQF